MAEEQKILFVVNPISGSGLGKKLPEKIKMVKEYKDIPYDIKITEYPGHASVIVKAAISTGSYYRIVAVGGDGTVNEIGQAMRGCELSMGIIPLGSGNGFARHLGYSHFVHKALLQVLSDNTMMVDMLGINDRYSLNVSGVGFDADVAHLFAKQKNRGVFSYIYAIFKLFYKSKEKKYNIISNGQSIRFWCFVLSFANSSQYGNNAFIAPLASITDGRMDICILKRPSFFEYAWFLAFFMNSKIYKLPYFKEIQCDEAIVEGDIDKVHIDGEAVSMHSPLHLKIHHSVLRVVVPTRKHV